jgi:arylsulfatase A-like enzyme
MVRTIKRRDPTRPALWYLSYPHPHPPLTPLQCYLDIYQDIEIDRPQVGTWAENADNLPNTARVIREHWGGLGDHQIRGARRAFYAQCTHIDHQLRVVIGTLREEELLDNTIILFTCDHGDMLGTHGLWAKRVFYENAAHIPMILVGVAGDARVGHHRTDDRLVGLQDVMPTLLDLAGIEVPSSVEGLSMVGAQRREWLYGECDEGTLATRMVRDGRFKLIYYATGNRTQLFDLVEDPYELNDLATSEDHAPVRRRLTELLRAELYGDDEGWVQNDQLVGLPPRDFEPWPERGLKGQRGLHWPPPPQDPRGQMVGAPPDGP